jgi:hypothetical protein
VCENVPCIYREKSAAEFWGIPLFKKPKKQQVLGKTYLKKISDKKTLSGLINKTF